jgi:hypothetical protein
MAAEAAAGGVPPGWYLVTAQPESADVGFGVLCSSVHAIVAQARGEARS